MKRKMGFYYNSLNSYISYYFNNLFNNKITPFLVIILPTNGCNLNCRYCPPTIEKNRKFIPLNKLKEIIDLCSSNRVPYISITGGEPLLHPNFSEWSNHAYNKGLIMNINTNGTLINKKYAKILAKNYFHIRISLDGNKEIHDSCSRRAGSYSKVIKGLLNLDSIKNRSAKIGINIVINKNNINYIDEKLIYKLSGLSDFICLLPEFNISQINYKNKIVNSKYYMRLKNIKKKLDNLKKSGNSDFFINTNQFENIKNNCLAGKLFYTFSWDGYIYSCPFMIEHKPLVNYYKNKISFKELPYDAPNKECHGCHATCAVEISRVFQMSPLQLMKEFWTLKKTFRL